MQVFRRALALARPLAPLATRLLMGHAFLESGLGKWRNLDGVIGFFTDLGLPFPAANAVFIATLELVGGVLLILGLGTRVVALLLSSTMIVALLTADRPTLIAAFTLGSDTTPTDVMPLVFLAFLAWLVLEGAGPWSLDRVVARFTGSGKAPV